MGLDIELKEVKHCTVWAIGITHDLTAMAEAAGLYECMWRPKECGITIASQMIEPLEKGINAMIENKVWLKTMNPENWLESYDTLFSVAQRYLAACVENHNAKVEVGRSMSDFKYEVDKGRVTITRYTGAGGDVVVPAKIDGLPVTVIGSSAFHCSSISGITLPSSITTIKSDAFGDCHSLTSIVLREGLTTVESSAFAYCELLTTIILPNSLVTIGDDAFYRNHPTTERRIGRLSEPEDWMCTKEY